MPCKLGSDPLLHVQFSCKHRKQLPSIAEDLVCRSPEKHPQGLWKEPRRRDICVLLASHPGEKGLGGILSQATGEFFPSTLPHTVLAEH